MAAAPRTADHQRTASAGWRLCLLRPCTNGVACFCKRGQVADATRTIHRFRLRTAVSIRRQGPLERAQVQGGQLARPCTKRPRAAQCGKCPTVPWRHVQRGEKQDVGLAMPCETRAAMTPDKGHRPAELQRRGCRPNYGLRTAQSIVNAIHRLCSDRAVDRIFEVLGKVRGFTAGGAALNDRASLRGIVPDASCASA